MSFYNKKHKLFFRRTLRIESTKEERLLWSRLRNKQLCGYKFFRQRGIGQFIVDFFCPSQNLAIELDGSGHAWEENKEYDEARTRFLHENNVRVLRYWNNQVMENLDGVLLEILTALRAPDNKAPTE